LLNANRAAALAGPLVMTITDVCKSGARGCLQPGLVWTGVDRGDYANSSGMTEKQVGDEGRGGGRDF
jgi:hypothetical protein